MPASSRILTTCWTVLLATVGACGEPAAPGTEPLSPTTGSERLRFDLVGALGERAAVEVLESFRSPPFDVEGTALRVDGRALQVYEYRTAEAARAEAGRFSPDGTKFEGPDGATSITWVASPHLYLRDRWIAAYQGSDAHVLGLLGEVMGPQFAGAD